MKICWRISVNRTKMSNPLFELIKAMYQAVGPLGTVFFIILIVFVVFMYLRHYYNRFRN
ncbi:hypothetical protein HYV49_02165 [Candidatus Pacearchaeota archaeon]|nr:hypothetical protein [Candidatus Pacearchaeota archaeon]